ncbi:VOC family protein [Siccirubricoccus sp. G192]|uniref:VOC family protein n=1 Tax=Siccirubricoccus sp. G192 TaxID=2849651 RepID=UPI001C2C1D79|nr:VOC family protein [Siccirubricoccus sp. G192]MBV1797181.1 VOC family protein [Siccirubricoccus sp. G192]
MTLGPLARVELACRDPRRQREFYARILGLSPSGPVAIPAGPPSFALGGVELVLRPRGDALFPQLREPPCEAGTLLAFPVTDAELDRWHRRMMTARIAVLEAPGAGGAPPRLLRIADPEGNVIELFSIAE